MPSLVIPSQIDHHYHYVSVDLISSSLPSLLLTAPNTQTLHREHGTLRLPNSSVPAQNAQNSPNTSAEDTDLNLTSSQKAHIEELRKTPPKFRVYPRDILPSNTNADDDSGLYTAAIAIGSNLGDSPLNVEFALRLLEVPTRVLWLDFPEGEMRYKCPEDAKVIVTDTSFLYETTPMYVTDQPRFYNAACMIKTNLTPYHLLAFLKTIERVVGRVSTFRNGPRAIDLDILFYEDYVLPYGDDWIGPPGLNVEREEERKMLVIPHVGIAEREFVLRPLNDMIPNFIHPTHNLPLWYLLKKLLLTTHDEPISRVIPFPRLPLPDKSLHPAIGPVPETLTIWSYPVPGRPSGFTPNGEPLTRLMATLNTTPDSFSDGNQHFSPPSSSPSSSTHSFTLAPSLSYIRSAIKDGASIIDIGGYSTRPGAEVVSVQEEVRRVVPVVEAMRAWGRAVGSGEGGNEEQGDEKEEELIKRIRDTPISVDTFRPEVAEAALSAGANCINDVYAFTGTSAWVAGDKANWRDNENLMKMKEVARRFCCPVIMMHSRGDAGMNKDYSQYSYVHTSSPSRPTRPNAVSEVLEAIRVEVGSKITAALHGPGGLRRWLIIADPGVGFSKTLEANLGVIKYAGEIVDDRTIGRADSTLNPLRSLPLLIGPSRKSFLGAILAQEPAPREAPPRDRGYATAAAVACAAQQAEKGVLLVRVHDVQSMMDVVKVVGAFGRV
ncbi:Dihydropteroate synthase-like protein [Panaeolus papilionaceus]|nr:Dihydropteroate synthase-like protein [Panaeolus papilionaceus]